MPNTGTMHGTFRFILDFHRRGLELCGWKHVVCGFPSHWPVWLALGGAADQGRIRFLSRRKKRSAEANACETEPFRMLGFVMPADRNRTVF